MLEDINNAMQINNNDALEDRINNAESTKSLTEYEKEMHNTLCKNY